MSSLEIASESPPAAAPRKRSAPPSSIRAVATAYVVGCAVLMLILTVFLLPRNGFQLFVNSGYHRLMLKAVEVMALAFTTTLIWAFMSSRPGRK